MSYSRLPRIYWKHRWVCPASVFSECLKVVAIHNCEIYKTCFWIASGISLSYLRYLRSPKIIINGFGAWWRVQKSRNHGNEGFWVLQSKQNNSPELLNLLVEHIFHKNGLKISNIFAYDSPLQGEMKTQKDEKSSKWKRRAQPNDREPSNHFFFDFRKQFNSEETHAWEICGDLLILMGENHRKIIGLQ